MATLTPEQSDYFYGRETGWEGVYDSGLTARADSLMMCAEVNRTLAEIRNGTSR